jgi:cobalt/nickel transport system permease protein
MHIPDGYLGPQTYIPAFGVMAAFWSAATAKVKKTLRLKQVPMLALGAAFTFVIMMFNVPIPGGTTGHATGAVLVAILFGPWAATVVVSLALIVQALLFGDGGVTAIGANCFNMAVVCPFVGWWAYRAIAGLSLPGSRRHIAGGAIGGWLGLSAAALAAGVEFGIQPGLSHDAAGRALYCPFGLSVSVPAMVASHMLVFGVIEGVVTALVIAYFQRTAPEMLGSLTSGVRRPATVFTRAATALAVLTVLVPLGLYLPAHFHAGAAWGEWSGAEVKAEIAKTTGTPGYVPQGIQRAEEHGWKALMPDYSLPGQSDAPLPKQSVLYILAGAVGAIIVGMALLLTRGVLASKDTEPAPGTGETVTHEA